VTETNPEKFVLVLKFCTTFSPALYCTDKSSPECV